MRFLPKPGFLRQFVLFLAPSAAFLIFAVSTLFIVRSSVANNVRKHNELALGQLHNSMELIFDELNSLNVAISTNSHITRVLNTLFSSNTLGYEARREFSVIQDFLNAPAHTRPVIRSIYIYMDNPHGRVFTTTQQLTTFDHLHDRGWLDTLENKLSARISWIEARAVREYRFEPNETRVVSVYRKIRSAGSRSFDGVIVLNVEQAYLQRLIGELIGNDGPTIFVLNSDKEVVVRNRTDSSVSVEALAGLDSGLHVTELGREQHVVQVLDSPQLGLKIVSATPTDVWFAVPARLVAVLLALLGLSAVLAFVATVYVTRANMRNVWAIMDMMERAEMGMPLADTTPAQAPGYNRMSYHLVQEFLKEKYRGLQLSERRYKQRTLELLALQTQINPHFLFNSLDALGWTIQEHGGQPEEAIGIIEALSDLLKYSLRQTNYSVTLAEELDQARTYAVLQEYLYPDALRIEWRIHGSPEKTQAISMVLQPLIENAIQHAQTDDRAVCRLEVCTQPAEAGTVCTVRDYGRGMDQETLNAIRQQLQSSDYYTEHIGLYNTNKRLLLAFGPRSTLRIESQPGRGTEVSFFLPTMDIVQCNQPGGVGAEGPERTSGGVT